MSYFLKKDYTLENAIEEVKDKDEVEIVDKDSFVMFHYKRDDEIKHEVMKIDKGSNRVLFSATSKKFRDIFKDKVVDF